MRIIYLGAVGMEEPNATGQTLRTLYDGIPMSKVLQLTYAAESDPCRNRVSIPVMAAPIDAIVRGVYQAVRGAVRIAWDGRRGLAISDLNGLNDAIRMNDLPWSQRLWRDVRALLDVSPVILPPSFLSEIRKFQPDVIHAIMGNVRQIKLAVSLSRALDIPIVPHFLDDWPATLYSSGELLGRARGIVSRHVARVMKRSPIILCIGEMMAEEYSAAFGKLARVARNGVSESVISDVRSHSVVASRRLVYAGGLHLGRDEMLTRVGRALRDTDWVLEVYGSPTPGIRDGVLYRDRVPSAYIPFELAGSQALLFVESGDPAIADYTRLSVSTKIPEYIAAGRPVVAIGPTGQASIELLARHAISSLILDAGDSELPSKIRGFLEHIPEGDEPARTPLPLEMSAVEMQRRMLTTFVDAVSIWRTGRRAAGE